MAQVTRYGRKVLDSSLGIITTEAVAKPIDLNFIDKRYTQNDILAGNAEPAWLSRDRHDVYRGLNKSPLDKSILVLLPAWCDVDVYNTVYDLYMTANNPHRVHVIVVLQTEGTVQDRHWHIVSQLNLNAVLSNKGFDVSTLSWILSPSSMIRGAGTARRLGWQYAQSYRCDYFMSLDSHSRFALGWDTYLIAACEELGYNGFDAPCLTGLPLGFEIESSLDAWTKSRADSNAQTYQWSDHLEFVANRTDTVQTAWSYLYKKLNMQDVMQASSLIKNIDPIAAWKILATGTSTGEAVPSNSIQNYHPILGKGSTEVMLLGYLLSGIPHYQGQFLPEYNRRVQAFKDDPDHPCAKVVHVASQAYKIAGGFVFLPSSLAKSVEFSTYFKSDDELLPSMRLIRAGAKLFTPNWNVVYHWYGRAGLPRPGWTQEVYDTSINAMHNELGFLGFSHRWYDKANKPTNQDNIHLKDCGFELNENDVVLAVQDGVRAYPVMSKSDYYDKVGFHRSMMVELQLMEFSSKAELTSIDLVYEEDKNGKTVHYVRPFYVFSENMATLADTGELEGKIKSIEVQLVDKFGTTVGSRNDLSMSRNPAGQKNIQILNTRSVKIITTVFCHPAKNIPVDLIVSVVKTNGLRLTFITSELFTAAYRKHVIDMSVFIP